MRRIESVKLRKNCDCAAIADREAAPASGHARRKSVAVSYVLCTKGTPSIVYCPQGKGTSPKSAVRRLSGTARPVSARPSSSSKQANLVQYPCNVLDVVLYLVMWKVVLRSGTYKRQVPHGPIYSVVLGGRGTCTTARSCRRPPR